MTCNAKGQDKLPLFFLRHVCIRNELFIVLDDGVFYHKELPHARIGQLAISPSIIRPILLYEDQLFQVFNSQTTSPKTCRHLQY